MKNRIVVKAYDNSGTLDDTHQKILNMATMNFAAMTSALLVSRRLMSIIHAKINEYSR